MVWLQPVENLVCHLIFNGLAGHSRLVDKEFEDEDLCETRLKFVINVKGGGGVLSEFYLWASRLSSIGTGCLVSMATVKAEH